MASPKPKDVVPGACPDKHPLAGDHVLLGHLACHHAPWGLFPDGSFSKLGPRLRSPKIVWHLF